MQQGMLFHTLYAPHSGAYLLQVVGTLREPIYTAVFERAWQEVVNRHAILRTSFRWIDLDEPHQQVHRQVRLALLVEDWRGFSSEEQETHWNTYLNNDAQRDVDLSQPPLLRLALLRVTDAHYRFAWTFHHLLLDGPSIVAVLQEAFTLYDELLHDGETHAPARRPFRDYITWLRQQDFSHAEPFWRQMLQGITAPTRPLADWAASSIPHTEWRYGDLYRQLGTGTTVALEALAAQQGVTLNTLVQASWALLLHRYTGEDAVIFGATRTCRRSALDGQDADSIIGTLINTVPLCVRFSPTMTLPALLHALREQWVAMRPYEHTPLVHIQEWSDIPRGEPLLESLLIFERATINDTLRAQGHTWPQRKFQLLNRTHYPLTMIAYGGAALRLRVNYDRRRFDDDVLNRLLDHWQTLLESMAAASDQPLTALSMLTSAETQRMLGEWNATQADYPRDACLHHLFEQQAQQTPEAVAAVFEQQQLTYGELEQYANRLAHTLQHKGVGPEVLVGIYVERSLEMLVGLLAVLKAGGAYIPLDPAYPRERLAFMLADSQSPVLLTQKHLLESLPEHSAQVVCLDTVWDAATEPPAEPPASAVRPDNLAYVIYTSGSTGNPKGVQIPHGAVVNFLTSMQQQPGLKRHDVLLSVTTLSFDIAVLELFLPLITGACTVLVSRETAADGVQLAAQIKSSGATVMQATPATWRMLLQADWRSNRQMTILCGGEALPRDLANQLLARGGSLWNMYGPTETTIWSTVCPVSSAEEAISIGRPIANTSVYVLDPQGQPVPVGVAGELCIGGEGLARGYLNRPGLTTEKFVPAPLGEQPGARIYRTGDLARYLPDGRLEYLGRMDHQVKIRGFRIELGEIETLLNHHPAVQQSVVIDREDQPGDRRLVAYVVPTQARRKAAEHLARAADTEPGAEAGYVQSIINNELRRYLHTRLPDYMVPSAFMLLDTLPLTPNGKIARRALPAPDTTRPEMTTAYVAPRGPVEEVLARIWADVLGVERVGIHDHFFELGGHSLLATRVISRLRQVFQVELPMRSLFEAPTIAGLVEAIETIRWIARNQTTSTGTTENREQGEI
jgi:amino acid adenylation domain-containing protein